MTIEREPGELLGKGCAVVALGLTLVLVLWVVIGGAWTVLTGDDDQDRQEPVPECLSRTDDLEACPSP